MRPEFWFFDLVLFLFFHLFKLLFEIGPYLFVFWLVCYLITLLGDAAASIQNRICGKPEPQKLLIRALCKKSDPQKLPTQIIFNPKPKPKSSEPAPFSALQTWRDDDP